jgi:hypothetical protein
MSNIGKIIEKKSMNLFESPLKKFEFSGIYILIILRANEV